MFLNIDHDKTPQKLQIHLAKPNKEIISVISEKFDDKVTTILGGINELTFSIPYFVEDREMNVVRNKHTDLIKEKMLIRANIDNRYEWFVVDDIDEDGGNNETFKVLCYSLGHELSNKLIDGIVEDGVSAKAILNTILENTHWKVGNIDIKFEQARRSFDLNETNALESVTQVAETFGAVIDWNTERRLINLLDLEKIGMYKGLSVDYGRLLKSISKKRTVDELTTRLHIYGSEDLSIHTYNPTGTSYLEDFSYFMYPFERDENRNVIKSSHFMSDELCHALLDQKELVDEKTDSIVALRKSMFEKQLEYVTAGSSAMQLGMELAIIEDKLDMAKASGNRELQSSLTAEYNAKATEYNNQQVVAERKQEEFLSLQESLQYEQFLISSNNLLTQSQRDELKLFVIEKKWKDDRYIDEEELYQSGVEKFKELRQPKVVVEIDMENLLEIVEEQVYWDRLVLGDKIKVTYPHMNIDFMARLMEIEYDFSNKNINVKISNASNIGNEIDALADSLYKSRHTSSILTNNKYKWDRTELIEDEVYRLINEEYDANKNKITAGVNNSVEIGNRGVIVRNPDFPNEMVIMQSGVIALSKDNGDTWSTAINPDGIIAERLIGNILIGRNLVMTNGNNSFYFDNDGFRVSANAFKIESGEWDGAKTFTEILDGLEYDINGVITSVGSQLKQVEDRITASVNATVNKFNGDITRLNSSIEASVGRIDLVVSERNEIKGTEIASAIALNPNAIDLISENINLNGKVTFNSLDDYSKGLLGNVASWKTPNKTTINGGSIETGSITVDKIQTGFLEVGKNVAMGNNLTNVSNSVNTWKMQGKTTIDGANIETGTITASKIRTGELEVGRNVTMGANAYISWGNIQNKPVIPTTASQVGAISNTYINSSGVWTGSVYANQILGDVVNVSSDLRIGSRTDKGDRTIRFNGQNVIHDDGTFLTLSAERLIFETPYLSFKVTGYIDFGNSTVVGLNTIAKFG